MAAELKPKKTSFRERANTFRVKGGLTGLGGVLSAVGYDYFTHTPVLDKGTAVAAVVGGLVSYILVNTAVGGKVESKDEKRENLKKLLELDKARLAGVGSVYDKDGKLISQGSVSRKMDEHNMGLFSWLHVDGQRNGHRRGVRAESRRNSDEQAAVNRGRQEAEETAARLAAAHRTGGETAMGQVTQTAQAIKGVANNGATNGVRKPGV